MKLRSDSIPTGKPAAAGDRELLDRKMWPGAEGLSPPTSSASEGFGWKIRFSPSSI